MQNTNDTNLLLDLPWTQWSKKDSEELVSLYLQDFFRTLDEYYLREALQIARDDGINFESVMRRVRLQQT